MKKLLWAILPILAVSYSYAQTNTFPPNGNVGIGTTTPSEKLEVTGNQKLFGDLVFGSDQTAYFIHGPGNGGAIRFRTNIYQALDRDVQFGAMDNNGQWASFMTVSQSGYVGIGTNNPWKKLQVIGAITASTSDFNPVSTGSSIILGQNANTGNTYSLIQASMNGSNSTGPLSLNPNGGFIGIGTTQPDQELTVNGTVHATSVVVDQTVKTPDYVFDEDYNLATLKDVKTYIDKNHHLPEIPSAAQVAKDGINLGEMNARLLRKIEELTLYLIEKDKEIKQQNKINGQLTSDVHRLKKQMIVLTQDLKNLNHN